MPRPTPQTGEAIRVYIAARSEDRDIMRDLRTRLEGYGFAITSRWLDLPREQLRDFTAEKALMCLQDIEAAHVVLLYSDASVHRNTTGGKHVETGYALGTRPIVLLGAVENIFHVLPMVHVVPSTVNPWRLRGFLEAAAEHGTPIPKEIEAAI